MPGDGQRGVLLQVPACLSACFSFFSRASMRSSSRSLVMMSRGSSSAKSASTPPCSCKQHSRPAAPTESLCTLHPAPTAFHTENRSGQSAYGKQYSNCSACMQAWGVQGTDHGRCCLITCNTCSHCWSEKLHNKLNSIAP